MFTNQELKTSTVKELHSELGKAREALVHIRIGIKTKSNKNLSQISEHKKYIARILTAMKELELDEKVEKAAKAL